MKLYSANWVLPISESPIRNGAIVVKDDLIVDVETEPDLSAKYQGIEKRSFGDAAILPGLVNTHTHLELTLLRGRLEGLSFRDWLLGIVHLRQAFSANDLLVSAKLGAIEAIRSGITTLADTCDSGIALHALNESGQRGIVFQEVFGVDPNAADTSLRDLEDRVKILKRHAVPNVKVGISPHSTYTVSPKLFPMVMEFGRSNDLPVAIHTAESIDETQFVQSNEGVFAENYRRRNIKWEARNVSVIEYLSDLGVLESSPLLIHCVQVNDEDIALVTGSKSKIAHCPKSNAKFGHGIAPLKSFLSAGISVGLGTDSVVSNNLCDLIDEARTACMFARAQSGDGMRPTASEMLRMATLGGAEALGMASIIGSLEHGKRADFCVVDLSAIGMIPVYDPETAIIFSASGQNVVTTVVAGRILFDGGEVKTVDEKAIRAECISSAARLG